MINKVKHTHAPLVCASLALGLLLGALLGALVAHGHPTYRYITSDSVKDVYDHKGVTMLSYDLVHSVDYNRTTERVTVWVGDQSFTAESKEFGGAFLKVHQFLRDSYVVITPTKRG